MRSAPGPYTSLRALPGGKRFLVMTGLGEQRSAAIFDSERENFTRLTFTMRGIIEALCPDGKHFLYDQDGKTWWGRSDGGGVPQKVLDEALHYSAISPDGRHIALGRDDPKTGYDIYVAPFQENPDGTASVGKAEPFLNGPASEMDPAFSPDGRWIAYTSGEAGDLQIFVRPFPGPGGKWQISDGTSASRAVWNPHGGELYYQSADNQIIVVPYTADRDTFVPGKPSPWSDVHVSHMLSVRNYDIASDGKHVVALLNSDSGKNASRITVLLNFFDEVKRKVDAASASK
jgi:serine/threonine-protein kinase